MSGLILRIQMHDERALRFLTARRHSHLDRLMRVVTHGGDAMVTIAVVLALVSAGDARLRAAGFLAGVALVTSHAAVQVLKRIVSRPRPALPVGAALVAAPDRFSFPSGHAASSLSVALGAASQLDAVGDGILIALALCVGVSRCYLGVHYPGDVASGWLLAILAISLGAVWL